MQAKHACLARSPAQIKVLESIPIDIADRDAGPELRQPPGEQRLALEIVIFAFPVPNIFELLPATKQSKRLGRFRGRSRLGRRRGLGFSDRVEPIHLEILEHLPLARWPFDEEPVDPGFLTQTEMGQRLVGGYKAAREVQATRLPAGRGLDSHRRPDSPGVAARSLE